MITPQVEMLEVPNFGHMTTSTIQFGSRDNICWLGHRQKLDIITFISKHLYFKQTRVANFADIIKIVTIYVKITFKD